VKNLLVVFSILSICNMAFAQDHLLERNFKKKTYDFPLREVSIIVTDDGYYPNKIVAFQGERIHFFITSASAKNQCFILQKHEVFVSAEKGTINEAEIIADQAGRFKFYCPSSKFTGHLTVFEKFAAEEEINRSIASEKPKYWLPRDYD
jgi:plastocyanin domain-containing protein